MLIRELDGLAKAAETDAERLASTRFNLTKLSRQRTRLVEQTIYPTLTKHLGAADAERVRCLREEGVERVEQSTNHIGYWTLRRLLEDWPGYQPACAAMLSSMRTRITVERTILYRLIEKLKMLTPDAFAEAERHRSAPEKTG